MKNTLQGVSVEVYLETKGMRVSKLSEKEYIKCGYHTAHGAIGFSALFSAEQRQRRKPMPHSIQMGVLHFVSIVDLELTLQLLEPLQADSHQQLQQTAGLPTLD